jgi:hypothetical protein
MNYSNISLVSLQMKVKNDCDQWNARPCSYFNGLKPNKALSDLVRDIKANSSRFINEKAWINGKFEWQTGFGAFTYSHSQ